MSKDEFYELIKNHYNTIKDEKKFRALLCDYFPQERPWRINALLFLYSHGIMKKIEKDPEMKLTEQARLKGELVDQYGMQARYAKWAVELWVKSYGKWVLEEQELLSIIKEIRESTSLNIENMEIVFKQAAKYPRVLRSLYEVYMPVIEYLGEKAIEPMVALFCAPLVDKDSVCTYEDYFELYKHLLELKWPGDYYGYGMLLLIAINEQISKIAQNYPTNSKTSSKEAPFLIT